MSAYVDASAFLKMYFREPDSKACAALLEENDDWISGRHTEVEVRRNLPLALKGKALAKARAEFMKDWGTVTKVALTKAECESAAAIAEFTGVGTLDALHLGAAQQVALGRIPFITFDRRQGQAARSMGWTVLGLHSSSTPPTP